MDLGHSAGSGPLNRARVGTAHTPARPVLQKEKLFPVSQSANRPESASARGQPVISARLSMPVIGSFGLFDRLRDGGS